jgi:hypothetical protein
MGRDYANYTEVNRSDLSQDEIEKITLTNNASPDSTINLSDEFLKTKEEIIENIKKINDIINNSDYSKLSDAIKTISGLFDSEIPSSWVDSLNYPCVIGGHVFSNKNEFCEYNEENGKKLLRELEANNEYLSSKKELKKGPYSFRRMEHSKKVLRELDPNNDEYLSSHSSQKELKEGPYSFKRSILSDEEKISLKSEPSKDLQKKKVFIYHSGFLGTMPSKQGRNND